MVIEASAIMACVGVVGWAIRQEGRINAHDSLFEEREKQAVERHDDIKDRLTRIESKLDSLPYLSSRHA